MSNRYHYHYGKKKTHKLRNVLAVFCCLGAAGLGLFQAFISVPARVNFDETVLSQSSKTFAEESRPKLTVPIPWPNNGYAAYAVPNENLFAASENSDKPVPIASLAKVITALAIMKEKPFAAGEQGPILTLDEHDVELYHEYVSKDGTVVPVKAGERISQYQALQAVMLISANNMSDSMVRWAFGSVEEYVAYANNLLAELDLENTKVADASGFSPKTVSTPEDMTKLGYLYMKNPVLREIALQEEATVPVAGLIKSYNSFANKDGKVGIKVGYTEEAGSTYLVADMRHGGSSPDNISVAVVLGANNLAIASNHASKILKAGNTGHDNLKKPDK